MSTLLFVGFFVAAGIAIAFNRSKYTRAGFLLLFIGILFWYGIGGGIGWPFVAWHLFQHPTSEPYSYYELRIVDEKGNELKYDARAAPPTLATPVNRDARLIASDTAISHDLACFYLDKAREYRDSIGKPAPAWEFLKFPRHQFGFEWDRTGVDSMGRFIAVRVYRVQHWTSTDGTEIRTRNERSLVTFTESACS